MNINEFIDKFYTDDEFKNGLIDNSKELESKYDSDELQRHQLVLDKLHFEMLFTRIHNEIYPKIFNIHLEDKLL